MFGAAFAIGFADREFGLRFGSLESIWSLLSFVLAVAGLLLLVQGQRVSKAWHVERGRHRNLVTAIRARRTRRIARDPVSRR